MLNIFCTPAEVAAAPERSGRAHIVWLKGCWNWAEIINRSRCTRLWRQRGHIHGYEQHQKYLQIFSYSYGLTVEEIMTYLSLIIWNMLYGFKWKVVSVRSSLAELEVCRWILSSLKVFTSGKVFSDLPEHIVVYMNSIMSKLSRKRIINIELFVIQDTMVSISNHIWHQSQTEKNFIFNRKQRLGV